jgi:hypothetical protein
VAGDTIEIKEDVVFINGVAQKVPPHSEITYTVTINNAVALDPDVMKEEYNLDVDKAEYSLTGKPGEYRMLLTAEAKDKCKKTA